jgi:hypothetical protein
MIARAAVALQTLMVLRAFETMNQRPLLLRVLVVIDLLIELVKEVTGRLSNQHNPNHDQSTRIMGV